MAALYTRGTTFLSLFQLHGSRDFECRDSLHFGKAFMTSARAQEALRRHFSIFRRHTLSHAAKPLRRHAFFRNIIDIGRESITFSSLSVDAFDNGNTIAARLPFTPVDADYFLQGPTPTFLLDS